MRQGKNGRKCAECWMLNRDDIRPSPTPGPKMPQILRLLKEFAGSQLCGGKLPHIASTDPSYSTCEESCLTTRDPREPRHPRHPLGTPRSDNSNR